MANNGTKRLKSRAWFILDSNGQGRFEANQLALAMGLAEEKGHSIIEGGDGSRWERDERGVWRRQDLAPLSDALCDFLMRAAKQRASDEVTP